MGVFKALAVNPNPVTNTNDRQWLALDQSGFALPSHGLTVPTDTPNQPARPYYASGPGNFTVPRFGWTPAYVIGYAADVAQDIVVTDWDPDDVSGYMFDSYGAIWPFGSKTPVAPTADSGAPFGVQVLPELFGGPAATTTMAGLQMHSGNDLPFGLGGYATGFGWMISMDAMVLTWGGPVFGVTQPASEVTTGWNGSNPGTGSNVVRDFKVNPNNTGNFYVLFESGYVYSGAGSAIGGGIPVTGGQADGTSGANPPAVPLTTANGWRWMKVVWGQYIVIVHATGATWGLRLAGGTAPIPPTLPPGGTQTPWHQAVAAPYFPGYWQDGDIVPASGPAHFWQVSIAGAVRHDMLAGALSLTGLNVTGQTTTTRPTVSWTYNETYLVPQKSYNVRIYPTAVTTAGGFVAGQNAGAVWISDRTTTTTSDVINNDLTNGAVYKAYVRVKSAADAQTAWSNVSFTMAISVPTIPTSLTATPAPGTYPTTFGSVGLTAGGSLPASCFRQFQVSAENGAWENVIGAEATTSASVTDNYPPTSVNLTYRVRTFKRVPGIVASGYTLSSSVVLNPSNGQPPASWFLTDTQAAFGPERVLIRVKKWEVQTIEPRGEFQPLTRNAMVVTTAGVKGTLHSLTIMLQSKTAADTLWNVLQVSGRPLLFETQYGYRWWVRPRPGNWQQRLVAPTAYSRDVDLELVEVVRPT